MHRFVVELLLGAAALVIVWPIEHFFRDVLPKTGLDDLVYKKSVQKLIERNRRFEDAKE
jgi:hypothetical protein